MVFLCTNRRIYLKKSTPSSPTVCPPIAEYYMHDVASALESIAQRDDVLASPESREQTWLLSCHLPLGILTEYRQIWLRACVWITVAETLAFLPTDLVLNLTACMSYDNHYRVAAGDVEL